MRSVIVSAAIVGAAAAIAFFAPVEPAEAQLLTPLTSTSAYEWKGLYFGGFGGVAATDVEITDLFTDDSGGVFYTPGGDSYGVAPEGFFGGAQAGFDWQWNNIVAGVMGEVGFMDLEESVNNPFVLPFPTPEPRPVTSFKGDWFGSATARVGFSAGRLLIFARGGLAFLHAEGSTVDTCERSFCQQTTIEATGDEVLLGWTAGAGAEVALTEHIRFGAEYRFYDFEALKVSGIANNFLEYHQDLEPDGIHTARLFMNVVW
jgi:outer membrane immunogenic protein